MGYGIEKGQIYRPADGSAGYLTVIDCETFADVDDVVVRRNDGVVYRIDSFKLAMVRYCLAQQ